MREGDVNSLGLITFGGLPYGDYLLVETATAPGYTISDELVRGKRITISAQTSSQSASPTVIINRKTSIILKKAAEDGSPLAGAQFKLEKLDKIGLLNQYLWTPVDLGGRDVTDANGQLSILGMTVGTYRITEIKAPAGYILNPNPIIFDVTMNNSHQIGEIHLAVTNYQGSAQLIKKDQEGNPLAGASFNVLDSAGNVVNSQPLVSNQNGVVSITGLAPGNYSFVETKAPNGYLLNTTPVSFTIANQVFGKPAVVTATDNFINYQGSAAFRKTDDKKNPLAGAVFALYAADDQGKPTGEPLQQNLVSDANGRVLAENLSPGHYVFVETKAPAGFLINTENLSFTIAAKHTGEPKILDLGDYLDYQGGFIITKVNSKNQPLAGAVFELFDGHGQSTGRKVTSGKDGVVRFDHLAPGTYYFKEIVAPKVEGTDLDYVINDSMIKVTIANHAKGNPETDQEFHYDLGNFQNFTGEADVTKNAKGGSAAGAVFRLWVIAPDGVQRQLSDFTVDQSGKLDLSKLGAGNYKLLEIKAAPHHILNSQPIYFTVKENQPGEVDNLNFDNYQVEVIGSKVNAEKEALAGATYEIYQADQNNQPMGDPVKFLDRHDIETSLITTDKIGEIYAKGLEIGHYVLIEKSAPKGYLLDTTVHPFEVTEQLNKPEPIKLGDFIDYQGSAELIKKDTDGHKLAGAEFNVLDSSGKVVNKKPLISDKEGKVTIDHLAPGDYQFVETKAPVGYLLNTTKVAFTIANQAEGKPAVVSVGDFINYQGSAELIKTDDQGNTLADAEFNVLDSSGKVVNKKPLIANPEGKINVDHLAPGDYQFVEIKAPTGYILNTTKIDFTITDQAADAPAVVKVGNFINYQGAAELIKTDDQGKALAGAKFNVTNTAGQVMNAQPLVSDKDGKVTIDHLAPGTYYFKEVVAPTGYILNSEPIRFTIAYQGKGQPEILEVGNFTNYQGSAELIKTDEAGEVLAGAEFNVLDSEGKVVNAQALVSDKDGEVTIDHLAPGNYQFVETKAPTGYVLNTKPIDFTIVDKADGQPEILEVGNFTNYQGSAELIKTDDQGNALADAEFNVLDSKGKVVNTQALVSDKDGKVTIDNLAPGDYQFEETKAPTGYVLNTTKIDFTIADKADGKPVVVSVGHFINYQGSFKITKVNSNGEALKGAVFELFDDKQQSTGKKVTSDTAGSVIFDHLAPGTYYFKEIVAPKVAGSDLDYVINDSLIKVDIAPHAQGDPQKDPEYQFDFGHFQNFKGQAAVTKVGEGKSIAGTQFVLWRIDKNGQESKVSELTVSADGKLPIDDLPVGNYKLVEIKPAPGYISNTQPIYFTIATDHPGEVDNLNFKNYQSEITGKKVGGNGQALAGAIFEIYAADKENQPIGKAIKFIDANGQTATKITTDAQGKVYAKGLEEGHYVLVEKQAPKGYLLDTKAHPFDVKAQLNEPKPIELGDLINYQGSVELIKTDEKNQPLAGAEFNVLDNEGEVVNAQPLKSDKEGKVTIDHLAPGDYQFVETKAPTGYVLNTKPVDFTIADKAEGQPEVIEVGNFTNYQGSAELIKTDKNNQPLAGAEFNVLDREGKVVNAQPLKSDKEGKVTIDHLAPGDYQFVETKAPTGYVLNIKPIDFTIADKAEGQPEVIEVGNFTNYQGSAELIKTDKKNQPLAGAEFNVLDSEGKVVNAQPLKSDKEGKVTIDHLAPGDYQFVETKAPTGYVLNTKPIDFTIADKAEGQPEVIEVGNFTNYQGSAGLIKTDEKNQPLAGAEFNVLDSEGKVVNAQPLKSDKEGKVTIDHLAPGDYQFVETKAPTGYVLNTKPIDFTIIDKAAGQPATVSAGRFINKLLPEKTPTKPGTKHGNNYPKTNDVNMPLYLGMGLVIVLATGFIWFKKQRS
ncbi:SpaA isopeptide-forming pilin-related protein [Enterococcus pseudoavium]